MKIDPARINVKFYRPERKGRFAAPLTTRRPGWAGLYDSDEESLRTIWIDSALLEDAMGLVATFSHELAHAILLGENRLARDAPDMEPITDLSTVALGLGLFNANVALRTSNYTAMGWHYSSVSRIGYLTPETFGYSLALLAWLREEESPEWIRHLNASARPPCKQALAYLVKTGDASVTAGEPLETISSPGAFPESELAKRGKKTDRELRDLAEEMEESHEPQTEADGHFADGFIFAENGQWQEAADAFSRFLEHDPTDGEAYQERAWAYLELGRFADAVADAEKAVELLPDELPPVLVRGIAYSQANQYDESIADLSHYLGEESIWAQGGTTPSKAYYFRGLSHTGKGDFRSALEDLSDAITRWPRWPDPYRARAYVYEKLGKPDKAAKDREEAARRETANPPD
jgi:tetratricopeptide (TPR) repeat protein